MKKYTAANGTEFTDEDIEKWAEEAEAGFPGVQFSPSSPGRPLSVGEDARPFTIRLDAERRAKLDKAAQEQNTTVSQLMRGLIDSL